MTDIPANPHRQPAYDAVFTVIGTNPPRSADSYGQAAENARVWRAVEAALDAMEQAGLLLPAGTRTQEQFSARVLLDGEPVVAIPEPTTRELAQLRVDYHVRQRATNGLWRGSAELVRRRQHTTPWEPVEASGEPSSPWEEPAEPCSGCGCPKKYHDRKDGRCSGDFLCCPCRGYATEEKP